ncbi:tol-pal system YbgF family protein [Kibdelosporangium aridum]|uniref:Uncharacterized protein n=1 Tax=Kibdelosporangium aridum TaxID=2030 RepID=A0A1W2FLF0_KIBAR|nr:hypothetical protein [Kibdelosporangium aridum]SMD22807.1 hypothetical protein SAMN05661093_07609 [Kibdelosporangium aridum]
MYYPTPEPYYEPKPELARQDRLAVAIGNASLLGVGYLLLGRRAWAVVTTLVTIAFLVLLGTAVPGVWFEVLFLVWWAALVAHGWYLARIPARLPSVRWPRTVALLIAVPVLVGIGYMRFDAASIEDRITEARDSGDCGKAQSALDMIWFGHHVVDGPMTVRGERTAQACARLADTKGALEVAASKRDTQGLRSSYDELGAVLTDLPGHDRMVSTVLDGFLDSLSGREPCDVAELADWLRQRPASNNLLDRSADVLPKIAPAALVGCGDKRAEARDWAAAKARYQQMLDQYPGHELTAKAQEGVKQATLGLELQNLARLGKGYCKTPVVYSGAAPYAKGATNRAVVYHDDDFDDMYIKKLPAEWQADNSQAVMVVCIGEREAGAPVRTCPYRDRSDGRVRNVTFSKMAYPVKAYELRTGNLVADTRVEIAGAACPPTVTSFGDNDPLRMVVEPSDSDIRAAFAPVFTP